MTSKDADDPTMRQLSRAIRYSSQLAHIGTQGLLGTFLPPDTPNPAPWDAAPAEPREHGEIIDPSTGTLIT